VRTSIRRGGVHSGADLVMGSGGKPLDIYGTTPANGTRLVERGMSWAGTDEETTREERTECVRAAASTDWSCDSPARSASAGPVSAAETAHSLPSHPPRARRVAMGVASPRLCALRRCTPRAVHPPSYSGIGNAFMNVPRGMRRDAPALRNVNPRARARAHHLRDGHSRGFMGLVFVKFYLSRPVSSRASVQRLGEGYSETLECLVLSLRFCIMYVRERAVRSRLIVIIYVII